MIQRLVFENLKHRPVRTLLSAVGIGVSVTMILTLVGVSHGMLEDVAARSRGTGADIMVRPPGSSIIGFSGSNMPEKVVSVVKQTPHVTLATGSFMQSIGNLESIAGIHLEEFDAMSGGFRYLSGGPFGSKNDVVVDEVYARSKNVHVGDTVDLGLPWHVTGIVEPGKLSRMFAPIEYLQEQYSSVGKVSVIWVKVDQGSNIQPVIDDLTQRLPGYQIYSMDAYISLISVNNIPLLKRFIAVIIGLAVIVGFMFVFLSMYTAVLERTREIGILKALGASPAYILNMLIREAVMLAIAGTIVGVLMTYGTRSLMEVFVPAMTTIIVYEWWPYAAVIALVGSLFGAIYPGYKAAHQDAIEALSYD